MKANQNKSGFQPVTLTMETQEEVNAMYAVLNFTPIQESVGLKNAQECLTPYATNCDNIHNKLHDDLVHFATPFVKK